MNHSTRLIAALSCCVALAASAQTKRVLFIGNSYTYVNDLPNTLRQLALSLGDTVEVAMSAPGGFTFQQHATYAPTLDAIASQPWDYVVLQEQSQLPAFPDDQFQDTESGAIQLVADIEANNECTWPVFYMTWGRENGDADNCVVWPPVCTYEGMQALLRERYLILGEYNDGYVAPVGVAWKRVRDTQPGIDLYADDGSHPSEAGTYLAASVFYCTLFNTSCTGATYIGSLNSGTAGTLRSIAGSTVLDSTTTWNMDVPNGTDAGNWTILLSEPDAITYFHPGQGTHLWTCSNGQVFHTAEAAFVFGWPGFYTISHAYTDPCGNSDTASVTLEVYSTGITEHAGANVLVTTGPGSVVVQQAHTGDELLLFDTVGRLIVRKTLSNELTDVPASPGAYVWCITGTNGPVQRGKVVVR